MGGPSWLTGTLAVAMMATALYGAGRLVVSRLMRREGELVVDGLHAAMGAAMAQMLDPRVGLLPGIAWVVVFSGATAWFAARAALASRAANHSPQGRHPIPHLVECMAMLYMLLAMPGVSAGVAGQGRALPATISAGLSLPALTVVFAALMLGHNVWSADRLAGLARSRTTASTGQGGQSRGPMLAPRLTACHKIAMSITMSCMLILML